MNALAGLLGLSMLAAPLELTWRAPETCPAAAEVRDRVRRLVGGPFEGPRRLVADARVARTSGAGWRVDLALRSRAGISIRRLEAGDCDALAEAVAVILALALDRAPRLRAPVIPEERRARAQEGERAPLQSLVEVSGGGGWGLLPGGGLGATVRVALDLPSLRVGVGGSAWIPATAEEGIVRARIGLLTGEVRVGPPILTGPLELLPEVVLEAGRLEARGLGAPVQGPATVRAVHLSTGLGLSLGLPVAGPFWLRARGELHLAIARPEVAVDGVGSLFRVAPWSPRLEGGLEMRLP